MSKYYLVPLYEILLPGYILFSKYISLKFMIATASYNQANFCYNAIKFGKVLLPITNIVNDQNEKLLFNLLGPMTKHDFLAYIFYLYFSIRLSQISRESHLFIPHPQESTRRQIMDQLSPLSTSEWYNSFSTPALPRQKHVVFEAVTNLKSSLITHLFNFIDSIFQGKEG